MTDLAARAHGDGARTVLGLLRACLEYGFATDAAIGAVGQPLTGADDIALR